MGDGSFGMPESMEETERSRRGGLIGATLDLALAGIGVVGLLADEAESVYRRSLERGRGDVNKVRERLGFARFPEAASVPARPRRRKDPELASQEWRAVLERLNLPTATQVNALKAQIADLEAQIEKLTSSD